MARLTEFHRQQAGDFMHGLLHFYRIELVHLVPNSIRIISTFVHLCEAYLGIMPYFHIWCHFFELKKTGKGMVVGSVGFMLHRNMKSEYIDLTLPDNTTTWKDSKAQSDPTRVAQRKVSKAEMMARVKNIFDGRICNRECPKELGVYNTSDSVSLRP
jgi:hypothetical protein